MQTLKDFAEMHFGVQTIVRRHFEYESPLKSASNITGLEDWQGPLTYTRLLDPAMLGLSFDGVVGAKVQGKYLAENIMVPALIVTGTDQRNRDGGRFTAEGIFEATGAVVQCVASPSVTYPYYSDPSQLANVIHDYGDQMVHMYLAGRKEVKGLWTEPPEVFASRVAMSIDAVYPAGIPVLFDLNFEQLVLLYYRHVKKVQLHHIPCDDEAWCPTNGGGIVYGLDGMVAEFTPELVMVES